MNISPLTFTCGILNNEFNFRPSADEYSLFFYNSHLMGQLGIFTDASEFSRLLFSYLNGHPLIAQNYVIEAIYGRTVAGDGRSGLMAELAAKNEKYELNIKGCGQNILTRAGRDGLYSSFEAVRETLASEYLAALGVPTTRVVAIFKGKQTVARKFDMRPNSSTLVIRLAKSYCRVGHLQYVAQHCDFQQLADFVSMQNEKLKFAPISRDTPEFIICENTIRNSARLLARMTLAGFIHGTLNTSHLTLSGESIDHGAYAITDEFSDAAAAQVFDPLALTTFGQQPKATFWLLSQFVNVFQNHPDFAQLTGCLKNFKTDFKKALIEYFFMRKGLKTTGTEADNELLIESLSYLKSSKASMSEFFKSPVKFSITELEQILSLPDEELHGKFLLKMKELQLPQQ